MAVPLLLTHHRPQIHPHHDGTTTSFEVKMDGRMIAIKNVVVVVVMTHRFHRFREHCPSQGRVPSRVGSSPRPRMIVPFIERKMSGDN